MGNNNQLTVEKLLNVLKKRWIWMLLVAVIFGCAASVCSEVLIEDTYTCRMECLIGKDTALTSSELSNLEVYAYRSVSQLSTREVMSRVVEKAKIYVGDELAVNVMKGATSFSVDPVVGSYTISVTTNNPEASYKMILSFNDLLDEFIEEMDLNPASVIDMSEGAPSSPSNGSRFIKYGIFGAAIGAFAIYMFFVVRTLIDVTIRTKNEVAEYTALPILGQIPYYSGEVDTNRQLFKDYKYKNSGK